MSSAPPRSPIPTLSELPLVVESPRIRLRPGQPGDADAFFPYVSDPELTTHLTWAAHTDIEETRAWLHGQPEQIESGASMLWTIEHGGMPIGHVSLHRITWARFAVRFDRAELGYWIARPFWGKGLMTEAAMLATRWAFETLGLHKVRVMCFEDNVGSRRVIEKVGYRFLCRSEEDVWRDGRWYAHLEYELTAGEWADSSRTLRFNRPR
jgi:[ribosomal protein S5]-alanine N-acetyltransferase